MSPDDESGCTTCCEPGLLPVLQNPPGLSALAWRYGTHGSILARLLRNLPFQAVQSGDRPLNALSTRSLDDPIIAFLDGWAAIEDVLSFYQERHLNEGFLRTATERRSVLELAREIGYELRPGVAAQTHLVFTLDDAPSFPKKLELPKGIRVQSTPGPGELPQTFETIEPVEVRARWNAVPPRLSRPAALVLWPGDPDSSKDHASTAAWARGDGTVHLVGISTSFPPTSIPAQTPANQLFFLQPRLPADGPEAVPSDTARFPVAPIERIYLKGTDHGLSPGSYLLFVGKWNQQGAWATRPVWHVAVDHDRNVTRVDLSPNPKVPGFEEATLTAGRLTGDTQPLSDSAIDQQVRRVDWSESDLQALLTLRGWSEEALLASMEGPRADTVDDPFPTGVFAFGASVGVFQALAAPTAAAGAQLAQRKARTRRGMRTVRLISEQAQIRGFQVDLERIVDGIVPGSWVLVTHPSGLRILGRVVQAETTGAGNYPKPSRVTLLTFVPFVQQGSQARAAAFSLADLTVHVLSRRLPLAPLVIEDELVGPSSAPPASGGGTIPAGPSRLVLDLMLPGLSPGRAVAVEGEPVETPGSTVKEVAQVVSVEHAAGVTALELREPLEHGYVRSSVRFHLNAALATHGETVKETLGSGSANLANQRFVLKRPPLTYTSAPTPSGVECSLEARVNGILWHEVSSLYLSTPNDTHYIVRLADDGTPAVLFGDGLRGTRVPTGQDNVTATYRTGIGPAGEVRADSLTLLQGAPPGIRSVTNPLAASGAAAPEDLSKARVNAPRTVRTLDRIVSLRDYEDFSRSFAGIGKAEAVEIWDGKTNLVHITVAGATGKPVPSDLLGTLTKGIKSARGPPSEFRVANFTLLYFHLTVQVLVDPDYREDLVLAAVRAALSSAFSFEARELAEPVTAAEIIALVQSVDGVIACDLTELHKAKDSATTAAETLQEVVVASHATWDSHAALPTPAELLLLNPAGLQVVKMKVPT